MPTANPYLDGLDLKKRTGPSPRKVLALWVVLILMFVAIYQFVGVPKEGEQARAPALVASVAQATPA
ncbi:MAG: hypothetical protein WCJ30_01890, partial [Deltaproteobacteria bacterium]